MYCSHARRLVSSSALSALVLATLMTVSGGFRSFGVFHDEIHSSPRAALIYLHATHERDQTIAAGMGKELRKARKGASPNRSGTQRPRGKKQAS